MVGTVVLVAVAALKLRLEEQVRAVKETLAVRPLLAVASIVVAVVAGLEAQAQAATAYQTAVLASIHTLPLLRQQARV